ncbi:MAG TPA: phosphoribosyltransferase family protein [Bacteroidales bacterium]|nr:phosphoribosyltransferase family protein [Bacteroidales bacterium]
MSFPCFCAVCGKELIPREKVICLSCLYDLPRTYFWTDKDNTLTAKFFGGLPFLYASSFLFFRDDSPYRKLLHRFKYGGEREIGFFLGALYGKELACSPMKNTVPLIIPVPMTARKRRRRGYNQAEWIAAGIAAATGWEMDTTAVKRIREKTSQTVYDREKRRENMKHAFSAEKVSRNDILIVDDVITTGATMESCACAILKNNPEICMHFASLAYVE